MRIQRKCNELDELFGLIKDQYGAKALNYKEAHEVITVNQGANYWSIQDENPCSVDDNYETVLFFVKENANPTDQIRGGNKNNVARLVTYKLVANSKNYNTEFELTALVNSVLGLNYQGSDLNAKSISSQYFGLEEHNFSTYFFTIDFTTIERIDCIPC